MSGLRELKKEQTKQKIIHYAKELFFKKGFQHVKTSEIARGIGIAEGTLFNYFSSKGELFIATILPDFHINPYKTSIENPTIKINKQTIVEEIINIIDYYLRELITVDKSLLREFLSVTYSMSEANSEAARRGLMKADRMILQDLQQFLEYVQQSAYVKINIDIEIFIECILSFSLLQFNKYVYDEQFSYQNMLDQLRKQLNFIMDNY
ncbi:TetR/AcrR family transcriptional regulator [Metabacillus fastidiosus]|uniref:TetR/AcrR family transcriptional regulator n=1 Tax=Metabacillus fastidiosus TaxID=1458 RepID=UPI003D2C898D